MDVSQAIRERWAVKQFDQRAIPVELLKQVVDAGYMAPTGGNKLSRQLLVVTDREQLQQLATAHPYCKWLSSATAAVVLLGDPAVSRYWVEDCSVAATQLWLQAVELGLGCGWAAMYQSDEPEESARREGFTRRVLGIPEGLRVVAVMGIGFPGAIPPPRNRAGFDSVVHWGGYGRHLDR